MKAGNFLAESDLLNDNGFVDVDAKTLEHKKYPQIFAIGDISGCNVLKSVGDQQSGENHYRYDTPTG